MLMCGTEPGIVVSQIAVLIPVLKFEEVHEDKV